MTKKELMDALKKSAAPPDAVIWCWDTRDGMRHDITSLDDGTSHGGCLDINCNEDDDEPDYPREDE